MHNNKNAILSVIVCITYKCSVKGIWIFVQLRYLSSVLFAFQL